jgi:AGCS family alanine or glycine:cation symporter
MALKTTEVTLAMLYRDVSNPDDPHGGTMYVCRNGLGSLLGGRLASVGGALGVIFTLAVLLFAITGGNMFQAWSVAETTKLYFGVPQWLTGVLLALTVGAVVIGGVQRIGTVVGKLVPFMCGLYVLCGLYILALNWQALPDLFALILTSAFSPAEAVGAFTGGSLAGAFVFGMKRALFSSEAGLGTAPIAHSAVKTSEPVTEGVVAGLEPFIDTLVVCTITALVILASGVWKRGPEMRWDVSPQVLRVAEDTWTIQPIVFKGVAGLKEGDRVFAVLQGPEARTRVYGSVTQADPSLPADALAVQWDVVQQPSKPDFAVKGLFANYPGAPLAAKAFDSAQPGLGKWMVTLTVWLFALSTMITYCYYGEQGLSYLGLSRFVLPYRVGWSALALVTCLGFIKTAEEIDALSTVALGFMLAINLPTMLILGSRAMRAWHDYFARLKVGQIGVAVAASSKPLRKRA